MPGMPCNRVNAWPASKWRALQAEPGLFAICAICNVLSACTVLYSTSFLRWLPCCQMNHKPKNEEGSSKCRICMHSRSSQ